MVVSIHTNSTESHRFSAVGRVSALSRLACRREAQRCKWTMSSTRKKRARKEKSVKLRNSLIAAHEQQPISYSINDIYNSAAHQHNHPLETNIDALYYYSRSGLWGLLIFLGASAIALYFSKQSLASSLPDNIMDQLGSTPPIILINCIFGISTLSSLIIIAGKIYNDQEPDRTTTHLLFRILFYLLYFISGAMGDYLNMVFISGLVVLSLQHYNVWNYYMRAIEIYTDKCNSMNTNDS